MQRHLIGEVIRRFESRGYKLVGIKVLTPTKTFAEKHYADLAGKPFFPKLVDYFSSGPVVAMVWEGRDVVLGGRRLVGATNPAQSSPGTVRGDFCIDVGRNVIHASDSTESAAHEISLWFKSEEVVSYEHEDAKWIYE